MTNHPWHGGWGHYSWQCHVCILSHDGGRSGEEASEGNPGIRRWRPAGRPWLEIGKWEDQQAAIKLLAVGSGCSWLMAGACWHYLKASPRTFAGLSLKHLLGPCLFSGDPTKGTGARSWGCHMPLVHLQSQQASDWKKQVFERDFLGVYSG